MVHLELTDKEADLLVDVLAWWLDDYNEATNDVLNDRTHLTVEDYLEAVSGMHETFALATNIKQALDRQLVRGSNGT